MPFLYLPLFIFLLITLIIGFFFSKKTSTFQVYAVSNKQLPMLSLIITLLITTWENKEVTGIIQQICTNGLYYYICIALSQSVGLWIISLLVLRMGLFMQHRSMPETIGSVYGQIPRTIVALLYIYDSIYYISFRFIEIYVIIYRCMGSVEANPRLLTIVTIAVLILHAAFGGIQAITLTGILHWIAFIIMIPLVIILCTYYTSNNLTISFITEAKSKFYSLLHCNTQPSTLIALFFSNLITDSLTPMKIQRLYMSTGIIQANRIFLYTSIFNILIMGCVVLLSLLSMHTIVPMLLARTIWDAFKAMPLPIRGFICTSLLALPMATVTARLNSCAIMISQDVIGDKVAVNRVRLARWSFLIMGFCIMVIVLYKNFSSYLCATTNLYFAVAVSPFLLSIFGFRSSSSVALIGMVTGAYTLWTWKIWIQPTNPVTIPLGQHFFPLVFNGIAMLVAHYLLPQPDGMGWIKPDEAFLQIQQAKARRCIRRRAEVIFMLVLLGLLLMIFSFFGFWQRHLVYALCQLFLAVCLIAYAYYQSTRLKYRSE